MVLQYGVAIWCCLEITLVLQLARSDVKIGPDHTHGNGLYKYLNISNNRFAYVFKTKMLLT